MTAPHRHRDSRWPTIFATAIVACVLAAGLANPAGEPPAADSAGDSTEGGGAGSGDGDTLLPGEELAIGPWDHPIDSREPSPVVEAAIAAAAAAAAQAAASPPANQAKPAPGQAPSGGRPGPGNTGVPPGTMLTRYDGDLVITTPGTVIDSLEIHGFVRVEAPGVVIRNSVIRGRATGSNAILIYAGTPSAAGLLVTDTELAAAHPSPIVNGVFGYGFTLRRVDIHSVIDSVHIFGNDVVIEQSWLHDNLHFANDPGWGGGPSHDDNVQVQAGSNIVIAGNTIGGAYNAALQVTQDQGQASGIAFTGNWVSGGGCSINVAEKGRGPIGGLSITRNVFGASRHGCAMLIPPTTPADTSGNSTSDGSTVRIDRRAQ